METKEPIEELMNHTMTNTFDALNKEKPKCTKSKLPILEPFDGNILRERETKREVILIREYGNTITSAKTAAETAAEIAKRCNCHDGLLAACEAWEKFVRKLPDDFRLEVPLFHLFDEARELTEAAITETKKD